MATIDLKLDIHVAITTRTTIDIRLGIKRVPTKSMTTHRCCHKNLTANKDSAPNKPIRAHRHHASLNQSRTSQPNQCLHTNTLFYHIESNAQKCKHRITLPLRRLQCKSRCWSKRIDYLMDLVLLEELSKLDRCCLNCADIMA